MSGSATTPGPPGSMKPTEPGEGTGAARPTVPVVAAVIERGGRYLLGRRPAHKRHGGLWEFPGGKLHPGETLADATARELHEELGLEVETVGAELFRRRDPGSPFVIVFVEVRVAAGEPTAIEHERVEWFTPTAAAALPLAPTDRAFVEEVLSGRAAQSSSNAEPPPAPPS